MIRRLTQDDVLAMSTLHATSFEPAWPAADMREHIQRDIVLGDGDPLSGFIILRPAGDQAEILTIIADPSQRGRGIGSALLKSAETAAAENDINIIFLEVAEDNNPAITLYRSAGYEPFGKRPAYYRRENGRVAALTFRKKLDAPSGGG